MSMEPLVIQGKYEHYENGKVYRILHESINPNTKEKVIVYREVGKQNVYHRPRDEFFMNIMKDGDKIPRFKLLEDSV